MLTPTITPAPDSWPSMSAEQRLTDLRSRRSADVTHDLSAKGMKLGNAVHIRVFKESSELELWLATTSAGTFRHYKTWPIAAYSGSLGPKLREGDGQAPEGFYTVVKQRMNPLSNYHLSFNLGYPNAYDAAHGRTGSFLMVHGKDVSIGCYAMTDPVIEEIYLIALSAFEAGQAEFAVHCFPFRMTEARMDAARNEAGEWLGFWRELHAGWAAFEASKRVPKILVDKGLYVVSLSQ